MTGIDTKTKLSIKDAIYILTMVIALLWGGFQMTAAVKSNAKAIGQFTAAMQSVDSRLSTLEAASLLAEGRRLERDSHD
jgi:Sec-independent protein translocase protein TatA